MDDLELMMSTPKGGTCCACGYEGYEETLCPKSEDGGHCNHWYDSGEVKPEGEPQAEPSGKDGAG